MMNLLDATWRWQPGQRSIETGARLFVLVLLALTPSLAEAQAAQDQEKVEALNVLARHKVVPILLPGPARQRLARVPKPVVDQLVFRQDPTPEAARQRLELSLGYEIAEIDRTCDITPLQKER